MGASAALFAIVALTAAGGCGKKGPPLAPLVRLPSAPEGARAVRRGDQVVIQFQIPGANTDGRTPADLDRIEVYGYTGEMPDAETMRREGMLIATIPVRRPPEEPEEGPVTDPAAPARPPGSMKDGFEQGDTVTVRETLGAAQREVVVPRKKKKEEKAVQIPESAYSPSAGGWVEMSPPLGPPGPLVTASRIYMAVGVTRGGSRGPFTAPMAVSLQPPALPPGSLAVRYDEKTIALSWEPPPDLRRPTLPTATTAPGSTAPGSGWTAPGSTSPGSTSPEVVRPASALSGSAPTLAPPGATPAESKPPAPAGATPSASTPPASSQAASSQAASAPLGPPSGSAPPASVPPATSPAAPAQAGPPSASAPEPGRLEAKPLGMPSLTGGFNVFVAPTSGSDATAAGAGAGAPTGGEVTLGPGPAPLNSALLVEPRFEEPVPAQTAERCYVVTTVNPTQGGTVQSEPSASVCVSLKDTFAPAPPRNLAAVGGADSVNLIWERSEAPDLAGYVVLRAAGKGEPVPLNDTPMAETTFRDARAKAGVVYRYVVVAVDKAGNRSEPSNAVEVSAGQ